MRSLKWTTSHAVFVTEIDDEHKEIFQAVANVQKAVVNHGSVEEVRKLTQRLVSSVVDHFAHEERLMRAARYGSLRWHKLSHDCARKRVKQFVSRIAQGDAEAGLALVEYLKSWLRDHTRLADLMLGAFLRNHQRGVYKMTLRTRPSGTPHHRSSSWAEATRRSSTI